MCQAINLAADKRERKYRDRHATSLSLFELVSITRVRTLWKVSITGQDLMKGQYHWSLDLMKCQCRWSVNFTKVSITRVRTLLKVSITEVRSYETSASLKSGLYERSVSVKSVPCERSVSLGWTLWEVSITQIRTLERFISLKSGPYKSASLSQDLTRKYHELQGDGTEITTPTPCKQVKNGRQKDM